MLRITRINANGAPTKLKLEGKIAAEWVVLLERECRTVLTRQPQLILDMTNVTYIDGHGVAMLRRLPHRQVSFIHRSRFLQELLDKGDQP